jgi:hypothetical protein
VRSRKVRKQNGQLFKNEREYRAFLVKLHTELLKLYLKEEDIQKLDNELAKLSKD